MDAKRFLFLSLDAALIGDIAWQVASEGHEVKYYIDAETGRETADGFVSKTTMWDAQTQAYDQIGNIIIPNLYYRDDIDERWIEEDGDKLQAWGYLGPLDQSMTM